MSFEISKKFKFEAAHHLAHHDGKCSRPHGHSYEFELFVERRELRLEGSAAGMVDDYALLSEVGKWIEDRFDHRDLNEVLDSDTTTAEELARVVWEMAKTRLPNLVEIRFRETAKTSVSLRPRRAREQRLLDIGESYMEQWRERLYKETGTTDPDACWEFQGSKDPAGYGWFSLAAAKTKKAHRASAWLAGDDIEGMCVLHLCDNPSCINPEHLYTGTHAENEADKDAKGRRPRGEHASAARLKKGEVLDIKRRVEAGETRQDIATSYGVSTSLIHAIMQGRVWRHVTKLPRPKDGS